ncbi:MAG: hypothetical protein ICV70_07050 [Jiangellaceae bacterium]|nr:hypothetical protein [Jiangellaceae bacterium]
MNVPADPTTAATRYVQAADRLVVVIVATWHLIYDPVAILLNAALYRSLLPQLVAWSLLAIIGVIGSVQLLRTTGSTAGRWGLVAAAVLAGAFSTAALPAAQPVLSYANWSFGAVGWWCVLLLIRRPVVELGIALLAHDTITLAAIVATGQADRVTLARFVVVCFGTGVLQLLPPVISRLLGGTATMAEESAQAEARIRGRRQASEAARVARVRRYQELRRSVVPVLAGLADRTLDPEDPTVRDRCRIEYARLRRLFAESDDVEDLFMHQLRACADLAERRGVVVEWATSGRVPEMPTRLHRALTEAPMHALAIAQSNARVTVLARPDEVAVGVIADASSSLPPVSIDPDVVVSNHQEGEQLWVESRWCTR